MKRLVFVTLAAAVLAPAIAAADCPPQAPLVSRVVQGPDGPRIVIDTPIEVCVTVPAPLVGYVAPAPSMDYEWTTLHQDFLPKILESVKQKLFGGPS